MLTGRTVKRFSRLAFHTATSGKFFCSYQVHPRNASTGCSRKRCMTYGDWSEPFLEKTQGIAPHLHRFQVRHPITA